MSGTGYVPTELIAMGATALGSAIAVLWRRNEKQEARHHELTQQHLEVVEKVGKLEGKNEGIVHLSAQVLETVRNAVEPPETQ